MIPNNKVCYVDAAGCRTYKNVVGRSARNKVLWHLAMKVSVVLGPPALVRFKPYVCFSENGLDAIADPKRTSAIRRRFCKNWWNPQWRQLQQAFCAFLANGEDEIIVPLDGTETLALDGKLLELTATRRMPDDLKVTNEPDDPDEPEDDEVEVESPDELDSDGLDLEAAE